MNARAVHALRVVATACAFTFASARVAASAPSAVVAPAGPCALPADPSALPMPPANPDAVAEARERRAALREAEGLELTIGAAYSGYASLERASGPGSTQPSGNLTPARVIDLGVGWRMPHPVYGHSSYAVGLFGGYATQSIDVTPNGIGAASSTDRFGARTWSLEAAARVYFLASVRPGSIEPWLGGRAGWWGLRVDRGADSSRADYFDVSVEGGLAVHVARGFGVGPFARFVDLVELRRTSARDASNDPFHSTFLIAWVLGVQVQALLPL